MRITFVAAAALLAAGPASAQAPKDVIGPRTLTPWMVACTDLLVPAKPEPRLVIKGIQSPEGRFAVGRGAEVVIGRTPADGLAPGQRYSVRHLQIDTKEFPREGEGFGAVRTVGYVTVTAVDEFNALATVDHACAQVEPGDYLEAYTEPTLPASADPMVPPDFSDRANVLPGMDTREVFGDGDTLSVNRGTVHGITTGARFAFYRDRRDGNPLVYLGDGVVVEQGELVSKLVIVKAVDEIGVRDIAVQRRQR